MDAEAARRGKRVSEERQILYKCDPKKNDGCRKTSCQKECFFTTHEEYRANNKEYIYNPAIDDIEVRK